MSSNSPSPNPASIAVTVTVQTNVVVMNEEVRTNVAIRVAKPVNSSIVVATDPASGNQKIEAIDGAPRSDNERAQEIGEVMELKAPKNSVEHCKSFKEFWEKASNDPYWQTGPRKVPGSQGVTLLYTQCPRTRQSQDLRNPVLRWPFP